MDDIIKDFHDLTEIPPFQQMISDKKYMDTEEYLDVVERLADEPRVEKSRRL